MPVNTMAMPCSSAAAITSASRMRAAGLDDRLDAELGDDVEAVAKREERVGGHRRAPPATSPSSCALIAAICVLDHAAHLPGADAERRARPCAHTMALDLTIFRDAPGEQQVIAARACGGRRAGDHPQVLRLAPSAPSRVCTSRPPRDAACTRAAASPASPRSPISSTRTFVLARRAAPAPRAVTLGARITSTNCRSRIACAAALHPARD